MRKLLLFFPLLVCISVKAQLRIKPLNQISPVLSKVIHDYIHNFSHIKGDTLDHGLQITSYNCLLNIKGHPPGIVIQYGDEDEHVYSWKNVLLQTEDYEEAKKKFHLYYTQVRNTTAIIRNTEVHVIADYTEPDDAKMFNTILFKVRASDDSINDLVVDLTMQYEMSDWKITLSFYRLEDEQMAGTGFDAGN